jgi:hypothetical protein
MRDRHLPRLCRSCRGPMARQQDACWRCGARWAAEEPPPTLLRLSVPAVLTVAAGDVADAPSAASSTPTAGSTRAALSPHPIAPSPPLARAPADERRAPEAAAPGRRATPKGHTPHCGDGAHGHVRGAPRAAHESERARTPSCWQRPIAGGDAPAIPLNRAPSPDLNRAPRRALTTGPDVQLTGPPPRPAGNNARVANGSDSVPAVYSPRSLYADALT